MVKFLRILVTGFEETIAYPFPGKNEKPLQNHEFASSGGNEANISLKPDVDDITPPTGFTCAARADYFRNFWGREHLAMACL